MDKNYKRKVKDFFRKEGFYFVLFICLCVIATVVVFTVNKNNKAKEVSDNTKDFSLNIEDQQSSQDVSNTEKQNAERVQGENSPEIVDNTNANETEEVANGEAVNNNAGEETAIQSESEETAANDVADGNVPVMSGSDNQVIFALPLEGAVKREFGQMIEVSKTDSEQIIMTRKGVDLEAPVGTAVKCVADGRVDEVSTNTEDGSYVVISHANGIKTKYTNLNTEIPVAVGDIVSEGQEIGTVGNSSLIFTSEICGDVLNIQVEDANGKSVDPGDYFNF